MKFTDGLWLLRDGVKPAFGLNVQDVKITSDSVGLQVATIPIRHRGDTLKGPVLSVNFSSPAEGIIGVKVAHFSGGGDQKPDFELLPSIDVKSPNSPITIAHEDNTIVYSSGSLSARINKSPGTYSVDFVPSGASNILTSAGAKAQAVIDVPYKWTVNSASNTSVMTTDRSANPHPFVAPEYVRYILSELTLSAGELVYGLGEQFRAFIKNGQAVSVWNQDGGTSSEQAYKCVPFYMTNRGYGIFINHPGEVELEIGSEKASRVGISVAGESLEYFIIYGPSPKEILSRYTRLTGKPSLPPTWTFGLWLSTSFLTEYDEKTVSGFLEKMRTIDCNVRVFHLDCFWMKQYRWCDFTFDPDYFPDPAAYLKAIKEKYNVKICLWINSYVSQLSPLFEEGKKGGYFIKRTNGDVWQWDQWQPGLAVVDFTNPEAANWYCSKLNALLDMGVDAFKTDFGERIPHRDVKYHDPGLDPHRMHNFYTFLYNKTVFGLLEKRFGTHEAVVFARSATVGGQRFPVHWGGDCESTFEAMAETLRGGLSLGLSGFGFTSHDIGGFEGTPPPEIYMRWLGYGLFSSHSRLHGSGSYRVPWTYGDEACKVLAKFLDAKHVLMPYLYSAALEAHEKGIPVQRATFVEFPDDRTTYFLDQQYCLGPSLLVAPIFAKSDVEVEWYLPAGRWISFWDAKDVVDGPVWIRRKQNYDEIPVFVREGSVLCLGKSGIGRPDYDYTHDLEIRVYTLKDGRASDAVIPTGKGTGRAAVVKASKSGGELKVVIEDGKLTGDWKVTLVGICESAKDEHGNVVHAKGGSLTVEAGKGSSSVHLTNLK